jgi:hypothetical protein
MFEHLVSETHKTDLKAGSRHSFKHSLSRTLDVSICSMNEWTNGKRTKVCVKSVATISF